MKNILSAGTDLISEMERGALIKKIRDSFAAMTKAPGGYLLMYNQNKGIFEWGIGLNLSNLKLINPVISQSEFLIAKIMASTTDSVMFFDIPSCYSSNMMHVRQDAIEALIPKPDVMVTIKLQMKSSILGIQFLFLSKMQAEDIKQNIHVFLSVINLATLALGTAVQREFSIHDRMTMMYNHEYFVSRLGEEIALCRRSSNKCLCLLMIDIDHFKKFNDTYGHQIGDLVLIESSKLYKQTVRMTDIVSRYGGEEFTIILPETSLNDAIKVAEKVRSTVEQHIYETSKGNLHVTISIGICEWKPDNEPPFTVESMVKVSDDKLYESKHKGRNCVCY